jgi:hypothetical protein
LGLDPAKSAEIAGVPKCAGGVVHQIQVGGGSYDGAKGSREWIFLRTYLVMIPPLACIVPGVYGIVNRLEVA